MTKPQSEPQSAVFVVDDDASVRESLKSLFRMVGHGVEAFPSASEFLRSKLPDVACCLVLDIRLPGLSGLDFQAELAKANRRIPIVFMTGHGDIPMTVKAMKAGAVEFLTKPFRDQDMLDAVSTALEQDRARRERDQADATLAAAFDTLSAREREVMEHVTAGLMNKQIAAQMSLAEITVKLHRGNVMRKMNARSVADLVKMSQILGIRRGKP
jgi:FixJ family two-component response regulator